MHLAIDGYEANIMPRVGIGRYAFEILGGINKLLQKNTGDNVSVDVYLPASPVSDLPLASPKWRYHIVGPKKLWTFFGLPRALARQQPRPSVIFSPTHYAPRFTHIPRVISIMDTSYLIYPELFTKKDIHQLVYWTRYSVKHAKRIFTISEFSKSAIIDKYGVAPNSVVVTYPGTTTLSTQSMEANDIFSQHSLSPNYILSVGTIQPRKNYVRLIEAFSQLVNEKKPKFNELELIIVGKRGWLFEETLQAPRKFGVEKKVKFLDFVSDSELDSLYSRALCLAFPSLYEGFGLPAVEAMAHQIPVVVSNQSSLPEIVGKAGIYVDPKSSNSIADGLWQALRERNQPQGKQRIQEGLKKVKLFSWEKAAQTTLEVLMQVGEGKI